MILNDRATFAWMTSDEAAKLTGAMMRNTQELVKDAVIGYLHLAVEILGPGSEITQMQTILVAIMLQQEVLADEARRAGLIG